jgi:hypothetical protein
VVGARVQAKASHVTSLAECHRQYGANAKNKLVQGTVVSVDAIQAGNGKRAATYITAEYELGGGTIKRMQLNSRGVKLAEGATTTSVSAQLRTGLGTEDVGGLFDETMEECSEHLPP